MKPSVESSAKGALYGLAVGDAMGAPVEFRPRGKFTPVTEFRDGGPFKLKAGQWTDDTSMALCLAASLIECNGMDAKDQMDRYLRWVNEGYMSCVGKAVGIGQTVLRSLIRYHDTQVPYQGSTSTKHGGNGCIMRLAPVPIFYHGDSEKAVLNAVDSARTTHSSPQALQTTAYFAGLIWGALNGVSKDELLEPFYTPMAGFYFVDLHPDVAIVIAGDYKNKSADDLSPTGYAPQSLEVALWAFYHTQSFSEGLLMAVNMGGDADTIGAIYGQLAGAYYGVEAIPERWIAELDGSMYIDDVLTGMLAGAAKRTECSHFDLTYDRQ
jgi:ADP-ribosyl-[dinitrogen reductase] hydrolase